MKTTFIYLFLLITPTLWSQQFVNGSFENNLTGNTWPYIFEIRDTSFCSDFLHQQTPDTITAQNGSKFLSQDHYGGQHWCVMKLTSPLTAGTTYNIDFYSSNCTRGPTVYFHATDSTVYWMFPPDPPVSPNSPSIIYSNSVTSGNWVHYQAQVTPTYNAHNIVFVTHVFDQTGAFDNFTISVATSQEEKNLITKANIFPNPSSGFFNLEFESNKTRNIEVRDITGRKIIQLQDLTDNLHLLDISQYSNGLYFVNIEDTNGKTSTQKIIKR